MDKKRLEYLLRRDEVIAEYIEATSIKGFLEDFNIPLDEVIFSEKNYAVGALLATQSQVTPKILKKIAKGIWDAKSNEFFRYREKIDLDKEPILGLCYDLRRPRYAGVGHSRIVDVYVTNGNNPNATIRGIEAYHPKLERYINAIEKFMGRTRVISLNYMLEDYYKEKNIIK